MARGPAGARPGAGEVLIRVAASAVNNTDINTRIAWYSKTVRGATGSGGTEGFAAGAHADGGWSGVLVRTLQTTGAIAGPIVELDIRTLHLRDLTLFGATCQPSIILPDVIGYIERNGIRPVIAETYPVRELVEAQRAFLSKAYAGKIGIVVNAQGQRLKLARKKAGLSMQELAQLVSPPISAQAISKYENDKMMPSSAVLVGLGKALGVSLDFLTGGQVESLEGMEFRKHSSTSAKDRALAEAIVTEKLEDYLAIEDILELEPPVDPFGDLRCRQAQSFEEIDARARELRHHWKLGIDPIPSMTGLLEEKGVKVIEADLPERFDGLACEVKRVGDRPDTEVVVISSRTNVERKRFSLAHELAHRVVHSIADPEIKLERAMNRFAAAFLVPGEHLREEAGASRHGMTYHELIRLKRYYGISASAMLMRLRDVGILPEAIVEYAFRTYARAWRRQEPEAIEDGQGLGAFEKPMRFESLVWRALGEQLISPVRAAQFLRLPLSEVELQIRGPRAYDQRHCQ